MVACKWQPLSGSVATDWRRPALSSNSPSHEGAAGVPCSKVCTVLGRLILANYVVANRQEIACACRPGRPPATDDNPKLRPASKAARPRAVQQCAPAVPARCAPSFEAWDRLWQTRPGWRRPSAGFTTARGVGLQVCHSQGRRFAGSPQPGASVRQSQCRAVGGCSMPSWWTVSWQAAQHTQVALRLLCCILGSVCRGWEKTWHG